MANPPTIQRFSGAAPHHEGGGRIHGIQCGMMLFIIHTATNRVLETFYLDTGYPDAIVQEELDNLGYSIDWSAHL